MSQKVKCNVDTIESIEEIIKSFLIDKYQEKFFTQIKVEVDGLKSQICRMIKFGHIKESASSNGTSFDICSLCCQKFLFNLKISFTMLNKETRLYAKY